MVSNLLSPYLELKPLENPDEPRYGNDRFEGFVVDFMDALAEKKNFKYTLEGMLTIEINSNTKKFRTDHQTSQCLSIVFHGIKKTVLKSSLK